MAIKVKFLAKTAPDQDPALWLSLFPGRKPQIDDVVFTFDIDDQDYDWLVVYEGLPPLPGDKKIRRREKLAAPRVNTMLITTEPASIRVDGPNYLRQYGHVLTAKSPNIVRHPGQIFQTPPLRWFYGRPMSPGDNNYVDLDTLSKTKPIKKSKNLSIVSSNKQMKHTLHSKRYEFMLTLKERLGDELEVFGRGIRPISNKAEAMDDFRYQIAIENHVEANHWTEKIADSFLAYSVPFYYGAPNITDYFPEDAIIPIDIFDTDAAVDIILSNMSEDDYKRRLPAIIEARRRVLSDYNLMNVIAATVKKYNDETDAPHSKSGDYGYIEGRHLFRQNHPVKGLSDSIFSARARKKAPRR